MLPDALTTLLDRVRARRRIRSLAAAMAIGGAAFAALLLLTGSLAISAVAAGAAVAIVLVSQWRIDDDSIARAIESVSPLDNLLVTATELGRYARPIRAEIKDEILRQAASRAAQVNAAHVVPIAQPIAVAAAVLMGCALLTSLGSDARTRLAAALDSTPGSAADTVFSVRVTPPGYSKRPVETHDNPIQLTVIAGSNVRIASGSRVVREWVATASESLEVRADDRSPARFLSLIVVPDGAPSVRITEPGRDTAFATPSASLSLGVESRDDLGLRSLAVRFTKASGGGENVTFTEGEVPLQIERVSDQHWRARAEWPLDTLALADGDVLVYRAISRDTNPSAAPVESDAFVIEIGRAAEIASAGFALPSEEKKYAISQQMVIYKTEQLMANRARHASDWLEQSRMIGMEQRMVRAEVVFLGGGDVQDEVEEAAHSHELAEGRLENQGRAEMLRAINFMSRAEAQLNDGNVAEALVFERQALTSLERALDRRRYFLRTLPDRSRIDIARRLTGERREAQSWTRDRAKTEALDTAHMRSLMRDLAAAVEGVFAIDATLAARIAAVDPQSPALQKAAVTVASAATVDDQRSAARAAMAAVTTHALARLPGAAPVYLDRDPLAGRLADEIVTRPRR